MNKNEVNSNNNNLTMNEEGFQGIVNIIKKGCSKADFIKSLKKDKTLINKVDNTEGKTLLHYSSEFSENEEIILLLLDKYKVEINTIDKKGLTPLHSACIGGRLNIIELLINKGAFVRAMTDDGDTPLHYLARNKENNPLIVHRIVNLLIKKGNPVEIQNRMGETPLHQAALFGREQYILYLINCHANPNAVTLFAFFKFLIYIYY